MTWFHHELSIPIAIDRERIWIDNFIRWRNDLIYQGLHNNLFDNHPHELDRWADDGGLVPE